MHPKLYVDEKLSRFIRVLTPRSLESFAKIHGDSGEKKQRELQPMAMSVYAGTTLSERYSTRFEIEDERGESALTIRRQNIYLSLDPSLTL